MRVGVDIQVNPVAVGFTMKMNGEERMREGDSTLMNPAVAG
jgi:hypothetical protein